MFTIETPVSTGRSGRAYGVRASKFGKYRPGTRPVFCPPAQSGFLVVPAHVSLRHIHIITRANDTHPSVVANEQLSFVDNLRYYFWDGLSWTSSTAFRGFDGIQYGWRYRLSSKRWSMIVLILYLTTAIFFRMFPANYDYAPKTYNAYLWRIIFHFLCIPGFHHIYV